jgi:glycosyltransferase involved in cell wall biosynthesis
LEIVGDGPLRSDLESLAGTLGLDGHVRFHGEIDHAGLPSVYRGAHACVISSRHEAQSMVVLEAAACGVPVVGTRVGIVPELTPFVVPIGDHVALAHAIDSTLSAAATADSTQRARVAATTRRTRADLSLQACTDRFRDLYARLVVSA